METIRGWVRDKAGPDVDPLPLAAIGLTYHAWRNPSESSHGGPDSRISDGEMFGANIATMQLILKWLRHFAFKEGSWDVEPSTNAASTTAATERRCLTAVRTRLTQNG
jgi:hypothetical protein